MMKYALAAAAALAIAGLTGCDRPTTSGSAGTTTVVKEPVVQKEKETVIHDSATPAPSTSTSVNVDTSKPADQPATTETTRSTTRVDTPAGTATKTETTSTTK